MSDLPKTPSEQHHCLMLMTRNPFNNHTGRGLVLRTAIESLVNLNIKVTVACFDEIEGPTEINCYELKSPSVPDIFRSVIFSFIHSLPVNELLYFNGKNLNKLVEIVKNESPDFVFVDMIRLAKYAEIIDLPTILDLDDLLSLRYQAASNNNHKTGFGYLSQKLPKWANRILLSFNQIFLKRESRLLTPREVYYEKKFNCTSLVSHAEARRFNHENNASVISLPMMIRTDSTISSNKIETIYDALFVGTLSYDANLEAFAFLAEQVVPKLRSTPGFENFKLHIAGKLPEDRSLYDHYEGIEMLGFVENLSRCYYSTRLVLAPSFLPGGIKTKVIESLAHGRPTIANCHSMAGLDGAEKIAILAEGPDEWVEKMLFVLKNIDIANRDAAAGQIYVEERYGSNTINSSWQSAIESLQLTNA